MKLNYHADTDSLYIELSERPSVDSRVISEGVVVDYDAEGRVVMPGFIESRRRCHRS